VTASLASADYGETNVEDKNGIKAEVEKEQENKKKMKNEVEVKRPQENKGKMRDEVEAKDHVLEVEQEFQVKQEVFDNKEDVMETPEGTWKVEDVFLVARRAIETLNTKEVRKHPAWTK
jgi:hypothetical protein